MMSLLVLTCCARDSISQKYHLLQYSMQIKKDVKTLSERIKAMSGANVETLDGKSIAAALAGIPKDEALRLIKDLESQMRAAAKQLEFEKAAQLRDQIIEIRRSMIE